MPGRTRACSGPHDPPPRENIQDDDQVAVYLDTFQDRQRAYVFSANPLGVQRDSILSEGQETDSRFDTVWYSEGRLTSQGYIVWMSIPFKSLRFPGSEVQKWGIALSRSIPRNNETSFWPHVTRSQQGFVHQFAELDGIERISPGRNIQLIPYGTFTRARILDTPRQTFFVENEGEVGLDAKIVMRNALALDLTVNPDFSQVESDDPQVTINQRFEVFFPEKRPFFLENAGFFQTPIPLFFSRRIVDPDFGGRLTGKLGRWAVGALAADDRAPGGIRAPGSSRAGVGMFRLQREFGSRSSVGFLATSQDFGPTWNRVAAFDARLQLNANWSFTGQAARSYDRDSNGNLLEGPSYYAELGRSGRHFTYVGSYSDYSPDFRSSLGFIRRVDVRQTDQHAGYFWQPEGKRLLNFGPSVSFGRNWDQQGRLQDWYAHTEFAMDFTGPSGFSAYQYEAFDLFLDQEFRQGRTGVSAYTQRLRWLLLSGSYDHGTVVNYSPPTGIAPFLANSGTGSLTLGLRPSSQFRLDQSYFYTRLGTRQGFTPAGFSDSATIFTNHLFRTKIIYQFSRALSVRTIVDYSASLLDPGLIQDSPFKRLTGDILLTYLVKSGTAIYAGYTDRYDNLRFDPTAPGEIRRAGAPTTSTGRQFFIKVSYLFRF